MTLHSGGSTYRRRIWIRLGAAVLSGGLLALAYALNPLWPAAWLAPIPLLIAAATARWSVALWLGGIAGAIGSLSLLGYMAELSGPVDAVLIPLVRAVQWAMIAIVARTATRLPVALGVFVVPALFAGFEVLTAAVSPHGSGGSIVYSQMDALPVIQVASLGGAAAIAFLLGLFANATSYAVLARLRNRSALIAPVVILGLSLGFGAWRIADIPPASGPRVALIVTDEFSGVPEDWRTVWAAYEPAIETAAEQGAQLAVLPEKVFRIEAAELDSFLSEAADTARDAEIDIVVGVNERGEVARNRAYLVAANGEVTSYDKRHLIPGFESHFTPGSADVVATVAGTKVGLLICKDLDFPQTTRSAASDVSLLLVPAWDFGADAWFHSRLAILRGVENGVPVARTAREGLLTLSDPYGRVLIETASGEAMQIEVGDAPAAVAERTSYSVIGDVFGWAALAFTGGALLLGFLPPPRPRKP